MSSSKQFTRRNVLLTGVKLSVVGVLPLSLSACGESGEQAATSTCVNSDALSQGELSLRTSAQYVDRHEDASRSCAGCSFFKAADDAACGHCDIFNGPVSAGGHCTSWNARA